MKNRNCPFCGWHYTTTKAGQGLALRFWHECQSCQARGPVSHVSRSEARELWNKIPSKVELDPRVVESAICGTDGKPVHFPVRAR